MPKGKNEGREIRVAIVASEYNFDVTQSMLERAKEEVDFLGATLGPVLRTPGVYDIPLGASALLGRPDVDAVVALGAVIEGETQHDEVVMQQAARKLADLAVERGKPVGLGITGPGETRLQAQDRIENAANAVRAAVKMVRRLRELDGPTAR
ncbi:MAG TPA: 6,7-dimethyl-8-ribityllumazine synthase [Thermoplasmata archaeon]|nr:6,7-dimethyl-8-ribityllumazine synthase [Thermoplasmata archaeon]